MSAIYTRAAEDLFLQLGQSIHHGVAVTTSFVEISGNECRDLYDCFRSTQLLTGQDGLVYAFPVVEPRVQSAEELVELIEHATSIRSTAATGVHDASSRSHAVLRIYVRREDSKSEGTLTLVDLAGSEHRIDSMYHSSELRKEGAKINASLMALKSCVHARAAGKDASHEYRKSKLTMALKSSFILPTARTVIIATVSPASKDTEHSLNTLRHACVMDGQTKAKKSDDGQSYITGGTVRTVKVGEIDVSKEARIAKARAAKFGAESGKVSLTSNGNRFSQPPTHAETQKEKERLQRARHRKSYARLSATAKAALVRGKELLGREQWQKTGCRGLAQGCRCSAFARIRSLRRGRAPLCVRNHQLFCQHRFQSATRCFRTRFRKVIAQTQ